MTHDLNELCRLSVLPPLVPSCSLLSWWETRTLSVTVTHPHTGSTGSAARSPEDSRSGNLPACSDSHAGSGGYCYTHPHLRKMNIQTAQFLILSTFTFHFTVWHRYVTLLTISNRIWGGLLTFTLQSCGVQGETFRAFTVEATRCVDTRGLWTTHTALTCTLVVICKERRNTSLRIYFH